MPQAHRIKTEPPAIRVGIFHFIHRVLRETGFWLLIAVAVGMLIALATFSPEDPAWTHTANVARLHNFGGAVGAWFADVNLYFFGYPAYLLPLGVAFGGWRLFRRGALLKLDGEIVLLRVLGFVVTLTTACGLIALHLQPWAGTLPNAGSSAGGLVGAHVGQFLIRAFEFAGGNLFMAVLLLAGVTLTTGFSWLIVLDRIGQAALKVFDGIGGLVMVPFRRIRPNVLTKTDAADNAESASTGTPTANSDITAERTEADHPASIAEASEISADRRNARIEPVWEPSSDREKPPHSQTPTADAATPPAPPVWEPPPGSEMLTLVPMVAPSSAPSPQPDKEPVTARPPAPYQPPPLHLLDGPPAVVAPPTDMLEHLTRRVEILLKHFGVAAKVVATEPGSVITRFRIELAPGVQADRIIGLSGELARSLSVSGVRVTSEMPGETLIGLEVPNQRREIVHLREVLETSAYVRSTSPLTLALGQDPGGRPVIVNLAKMPHLLMAGVAGSGKSAALNAMLLSLLYKAAPGDLRLILVEPEAAERSVYRDIPHLLAPVIADRQGAINALRWCVGEMEHRCRLTAALNVRHITGFNRKIADAQATRSTAQIAQLLGENGVVPLPFIVVVIDDLADVTVVSKRAEALIARLTQKAHTVGIHLILTTRQPSEHVITGLIKAGVPARIAMRTSSQTDSRVILDQTGAEQLLEHGDMLYLPADADSPQRVLGAFASDHEIGRVTGYLRRTGVPDYRYEISAGSDEDEPTAGGQRH